MIKLVVFDFDGTLTPPELDGNWLIAKYLGIEKEVTKLGAKYSKKEISGEKIVTEFAKLFKGLTKNDIKKIRKQIKLRPGVIELFNELKKREIKIAIVTGEGNQMMDEMLKFLKPNYFDGVDWVFEGDIMNGKIDWDFEYKKELPHHLQNMFDLKPKEMMAVGDTWADFDMVPKGGIKVSIGNRSASKESDYNIKEISGVLKIIDELK